MFFIWFVLFQHLAHYASENLEAMNPPLFLRFLNLLMNDAIFLLDEAIQVSVGSSSIYAKQKTPALVIKIFHHVIIIKFIELTTNMFV